MATTKTKTYGEDRICEGANCTTRLSRFNRDELCATCHRKVVAEGHRINRIRASL